MSKPRKEALVPHCVVVDLDGRFAPAGAMTRFLKVADRYDASCMGHDLAGTSDMCFRQRGPLDEQKLAEELGVDIPVIRFDGWKQDEKGRWYIDVSNRKGILLDSEGFPLVDSA